MLIQSEINWGTVWSIRWSLAKSRRWTIHSRWSERKLTNGLIQRTKWGRSKSCMSINWTTDSWSTSTREWTRRPWGTCTSIDRSTSGSSRTASNRRRLLRWCRSVHVRWTKRRISWNLVRFPLDKQQQQQWRASDGDGRRISPKKKL